MASTRLIDGNAVAEGVKAGLRDRIAAQTAERGEGYVRLDAILVSDERETAAHVYAKNQARTCASLGIGYTLHEVEFEPGEEPKAIQKRTRALIRRLNADPAVHGIMMHMPLPEGVDAVAVRGVIAPEKDVEGVTPTNIGNIIYGRSSLAPCTALAIMECLASVGLKGDALKGKHAVVVGASDTVGKPIAAMLMRPEATVTSCNVHTPDTPGLCRGADIVVACAGVAHLVKGDWVKPGAVVIDVGIHRVPVQGDTTGVKLRTVGDVEPEGVGSALGVDGWLSPVPGGVGPVTVAMLLGNVVSAAEAASEELEE